ncbi:MAG: hypothetical protein J0M34_06875 [Alphaproteobacteria bacterium]|nr:hypothetical protein [Alphaproteobacteria bacterium]
MATEITFAHSEPAPQRPQSVPTASYVATQRAATRVTPPDARQFDVQKMAQHHHIHVEHGSLFVDPYLVIHPRELDPANEEALKRKLRLTYSINDPSFFESAKRLPVALNMGQLIPVSLAAKRSKLQNAIKQFNDEASGNGLDQQLARDAHDRNHPMAAIVRDTLQEPHVDPVGLEMLKNSLAMYMLCREQLTRRGYYGKLTDYIKRTNSPEQVLSDLQEELGVTPSQIQDAALNGGIDGVGRLMGLDANYIAEVKRLSDVSAQSDFSYNLVEHWHIGRQVLSADASFEQKLSSGLEARINAKIKEYRSQVRHHYDVPEPIRKEENRIAQALKLVHPTQAALMFELGYELCYSPEMTADKIAFHPGIYGLHRKSANDLRDIQGTYRIYFSGKGDLKGSMRTLVHEVTHNLWPDYLTEKEVRAIDTLAAADRDRFRNLSRLMDEKFDSFAKYVHAYHAGNPQEKQAVLTSMNEHFALYNVRFDRILPTLKDPYELMFMTKHAADRLHVEGEMYNKSGYDTPQERFREVLSRFSELKLVELRDNQPLLEFIAPGLNKVFNDYYIPHLERVRSDIYSRASRNESPVTRTAAYHASESQPAQEQTSMPRAADAACEAHDKNATPETSISTETAIKMGPALQALESMGAYKAH